MKTDSIYELGYTQLIMSDVEGTRDTDYPLYFRSFKSGPLDAYRNNASFDWRDLRLHVEGEDILEFKV